MSNISYKHFIYDHELMLYPYAPLGLLHNKGEWPEPKYNLSIVISASVEDLNILEWITYHQALGVEHIYLYCTDEDPTDLYRQIIAFTLGKKPFITFHHYRFSKSNTQIYFHYIRNYLHETEWHINLDINDYLYINENETLSNFIDHFIKLNINIVYFNIILCSGKDIDASVEKKTILQQTYPIDYPCIDTKPMVRSRTFPYQYIFQHLDKPVNHHINKDELVNDSCNVLQQSMANYYKNFPYNALEIVNSNIQEKIIATAYIAHFCNENDINKEELNKHPSIILHHHTPEQYWKKTLKKVWKQSFHPAPLPLLSILSHDKPCQQSSAPEKYKPEELAYILTNGQIKGTTQSITKKETNPWWEIDLQKSFIVKNIRLFNGIDLNIKNMNHFIIESSEDHQFWIKRHKKINSNLFAGVDGSYYNWTHPLGIKARWIRITVPGDNQIFSLDQIRILGMNYKKFNIP